MDFESRFKDVFEKLQIFRDHLNEVGDEGYAQELEYIMPELKETPDERIRRWLYNLIESCAFLGNRPNGIELKDILSWIERQKATEAPKWMIDFLDGYRRKIGSCLDYDEAKEIDSNILCILEWLKGNPNIEQKPVEWSEEDELRIKSIKSTLEQFVYDNDMLDVNGDCCDDSMKKNMNWLKSLKPQPKHQWTDEDEKNLRDLIAFGQTKLGLRRWIAGLPEKLGSRSEYHWKPSEEQLEAFIKNIELVNDNETKPILIELLEQLKALKEG